MPVTTPQRHCWGVVEHTWKPLMVTGMCLATARWVWRCAITAAMVDEHLSKGLYCARPHQRKRRSTPGSPTIAERITPGLAHRATASALGSASAGLSRSVYCVHGSGASLSAWTLLRQPIARNEAISLANARPMFPMHPYTWLSLRYSWAQRSAREDVPARRFLFEIKDHSARRGHWP